MAGVEGLDHTLKLPGNIQKHIENLDRLAKKDAELNKRIPSLSGLMKDVLGKLEREPAIVEVTNPKTKKKVKIIVNKFVVQMLTSFAFGSGDGSLPLAYYGMSKGDFRFAANRWLGLITSNRRIGSAMTFMMDCHSGATRDRLKQIRIESERTLLGNVMNFPFPEVCEGWGKPDAGASFRNPVKTKVPTLFISGTLDVRTPPGNAEEVRENFQNSTHLIIDGAVHSDPLFLSSPKIKETMIKFMKAADLPATINIGMAKPFRFQEFPEETSSENGDAKRINDFITPFAKANHFSGVVLAEKNGKLIFEKAFGLASVEHNVPNRLNTRFGIASINKPMTYVVLLRLIEEGKIGINDKLSKYIPDFPSSDKITIEMIGRHRSGIPHRVMPAEEETIRYTPAAFVEKVKKAKLEFEPGTDDLYSSAGYAVLARVLEIASGKPFAQLLQEYVFDPAGMNDSMDYDSTKIIKNEARSYLLETGGYSAAAIKDYSFLVGAGSVFSTARDLYKFGRASIDGRFVAKSKLNLVRNGIFRSNGSSNGFRSNVRIDTEKKYGYVVISNLGSGANDLVINNLRNLLEGKEMVTPQVPNPKFDKNISNDLKEYVGKYKLGRSGFDILTRDEELFAGPFKLLPMGKDKYYNFWSYAEVTFVRNAAGKVKGLEWVGSAGKSDWVKQ
jgi:CubicO group peptidase (beta-lactamase class C family)